MKALAIFLSVTVLFLACEMDPFLFNSKSADSYELPGNTIPDLLIEEISFQSGGNTLYGIWIDSNGERPGLTLLYCHGNKYGIDEYWDRVQILHGLGVNVFIFDYRGYGKSEGSASEKGLYEDGKTAWQVIHERYGVTQDSLILYGYSLGNVVSIYLAAEQVDPLCLFAESPFASATSLVQGGSGLDLPALWLTEGEYDNAERVQEIQTPFCLFHGEDDDFVRWRDNGRIVYENAPEPKELHLIPHANHTDIPEVLGEEVYLQIMRDWIQRSME